MSTHPKTTQPLQYSATAVQVTTCTATATATLQAVLDAADSQLIIVLDARMQIQHISAGITAMLGWTPPQASGQPYSLLFTGQNSDGLPLAPDAVSPCTSLALSHPVVLTGRARLRTQDGFSRAVRLTSSAVQDEAGATVGTVVIAVEGAITVECATAISAKTAATPHTATVTQPVRATSGAVERRLANSEEQFRLTFDRSPTAMAIISLSPATLGRVRRLNAAFEAFTGRRRRELFSMSVRQLLHPEEVPAHLAYLHLAAQTGRCEPDGVERRFLHADGHIRWARKTTAVVTPTGSPEPHLLVQLHDTTEQRAASEALAHAALHDPLTGLANRALFADRLELALIADRRYRTGVSLLYLDLDAFKPINDRYGHAAGDAVLVEVARRLREAMRGEDTVARLGGDEFAVICPALGTEHLPVVLARLRHALGSPIRLGPDLAHASGEGSITGSNPGMLVEVGVSIGTATGTHDVDDDRPGVIAAPTLERMLAVADDAMYFDKQTGGRPTDRGVAADGWRA